jgi:hypothetical protein
LIAIEATAAIAMAGSSDAPRISASASAGTTAFHTTADGAMMRCPPAWLSRSDRVMSSTLWRPVHPVIRANPPAHLVVARALSRGDDSSGTTVEPRHGPSPPRSNPQHVRHRPLPPWSGKPDTLRCPAPLRTGRARFRAPGSSKPPKARRRAEVPDCCRHGSGRERDGVRARRVQGLAR